MNNITTLDAFTDSALQRQSMLLEKVRAFRPREPFLLSLVRSWRIDNLDNDGDESHPDNRFADLTWDLDMYDNSVYLDLYFRKQDGLKSPDLIRILDSLLNYPGLISVREHTWQDVRTWAFSYHGLQDSPIWGIKVRCWTENSNSCRTVGTGEFIEKTKIVCD
jgi:hypothetical protein